MNKRMIARILGKVLLIFAALMLLPRLVDLSALAGSLFV